MPIPLATKEMEIGRAKKQLDLARLSEDRLLIDLAEAGLNALLDTYQTEQTEEKQ